MNYKQSKRAFRRLLISRCNVYRKMRVRHNSGFQHIYVRVSEAERCRYSTVSRLNSENVKDDRHGYWTESVFYLQDIEMKQGDRIVWNGDIYEVKLHPRNPSGINHHMECPVEILDRIEFEEVKDAQGRWVLRVED